MPHKYFCIDCQSVENLASHMKEFPEHRMSNNPDHQQEPEEKLEEKSRRQSKTKVK